LWDASRRRVLLGAFDGSGRAASRFFTVSMGPPHFKPSLAQLNALR
jgi:hypothetical protein